MWGMRVRTPLAAFVLAAGLFVSVLASSALFVSQGYRDSIRRGEEKAGIAAQIVAVHFQWLIEASRQSLRRIDDTLGYRPELLATAMLGDLDDAIEGLPQNVEVRLFDRNGREILSTAPRGEINIADRPYFQELRDGAAQVISQLLIDRITGERSFIVGRRLLRSGKFAGVAVIVVPTSLMSQVWLNLDLGPDSAISVVRKDGLIVARHPGLAEGSAIGSQVVPEGLGRQESGTYRRVSRLDGVERLIGFHRVSNSELIAFAAVASEAALADFNRRIVRISVIAVPVFLALLAMTVWVSRLLVVDRRRRLEAEESLAQNKMLLREIHHRVKNNLQTVASLVRLQPLPEDAKRDLSRRVAAMAMVHEQIYRSDRLDTVDLSMYLRELVGEVVQAFGANSKVELGLEPAKIDADRAMVVGLIVTEVVSNSLKHAFPGEHRGQINFSLTIGDDGQIRLTIEDDGVGFDPQAVKAGLGLKLIDRFAQQLGGRYEISGNGGLRFVLSIPVAMHQQSGP